MIASKTPIGVVFDVTNTLAIAKDEFTEVSWGNYGDISDIQNYSSASSSTGDWQGFKNTKAIYDYAKSQNSFYPAMEKVLLYSTTGTEQGQWYIPAAGELNAISINKDAINATLDKIGGTSLSGFYWSSTEQDSNNAWRISLGESFSNAQKGNTIKVKPIINFASKDKIDAELDNRVNECHVGDILYSDKTCSSSIISGTTPIGVVVNGSGRLAVALDGAELSWSTENVDIQEIPNICGTSDFNGKSNTAAMIARGADKYPAAKYAYEYATPGTQAGDWYLPAAGEVFRIAQNIIKIKETFSLLGKSLNEYTQYWSSTECSSSSASKDYLDNLSGWRGHSSKIYKDYVRPVLAF